MNHDVRKIRKAIKMRKKLYTPHRTGKGKELFTSLPTDMERFGFYPDYYEIAEGKLPLQQKNVAFSLPFLLKIASAFVLFVTSSFLLQSEQPTFSRPKQWLQVALTQEFPFATFHDWYVTTFGERVDFTFLNGNKLAPIKRENALPASGEVVESFKVNGTGVHIRTPEQTDVTAVAAGIVLFAGNDRKTNKTVIIQHADGSVATYGYLHTIDVHPYQAVTQNEKVGSFYPTDANETFFFAVRKENQFIDPLQVIPAYDAP